MAVEREFTGWKAVLNTTEFLLTDDLRRDLSIWQAIDPTTPALEFRTCTMVDLLDQKNLPIREAPLVLQRHHGTFASGRLARGRRFMHRGPMGHYGIGRHSIGLPSRPSLLHLLWFGYAPYEQVKQRKMQIGRRVPVENLMLGMGNHHLRTEEELDRDYYELAAAACDLMTDPDYRWAYHRVQRWYELRPKRGDTSDGRA
jgi:hypothetical protein